MRALIIPGACLESTERFRTDDTRDRIVADCSSACLKQLLIYHVNVAHVNGSEADDQAHCHSKTCYEESPQVLCLQLILALSACNLSKHVLIQLLLVLREPKETVVNVYRAALPLIALCEYRIFELVPLEVGQNRCILILPACRHEVLIDPLE